MTKNYDPQEIELKWQKRWKEAKVYDVDLRNAKNPYYTHVMWPYPSGDRLHIGHWYNYSPADSYARFKRMQGHDVFSPMGFDAFGLPAENYAIETGIHPDKSTNKNVETMTEQLKRMGCMYDWSTSANSSKPEYYKWTQWLFLQMFKNNLAYRKEATLNFCPKCQTVLANEQVWDGACERCDSDVVQKPFVQWYWKITDYAERLLNGLDDLQWPEKTKLMQRNWIGRSEGVNIKSKIKDFDFEFYAYDSVPQTFCAQTFSVIAPEHPILPKLVAGTKHEKEVLAFAEKVKRKKATERYNFAEDLDGVFTGRFVDDPFGTGDLPLWVASFVVMEYGSGIVHCSAHDERDFAFAKKYKIPLQPVMFPEDKREAEKVRNLEYCFAKDPQGILEQPEEFKGRRWGEVREDIIKHMQMKGFGEHAVHYRLRDWCISRQRYWGAPIPIIHCEKCGEVPVPEKDLPVLLPKEVDFLPKGGRSPLATAKDFVNTTCPKCKKAAEREVDTMDTFVCSSYYSLMYLAASNKNGEYTQRPIGGGTLVDPQLEKKWLPVSCYIGGAEHACMHLIYARFVGMALKDFGFIEHAEQYKKLVHQGIITNKGAKMSKSRGNVVSPDSFVEREGSDVFRMYLMFMGPFTEGGDWSDTGIKGIARFASRIHSFFVKNKERTTKNEKQDIALTRLLHRTIKKVGEDIEKLHFNTAISALMIFLNEAEKAGTVSKETALTFTKLLAPLAPHLAEELWESLGMKEFVITQSWPTYDPKYLVADTLTIPVQVNGKVRGEIEVATDTSENDVLKKAKEHENVKRHIQGKRLKKEMYVKGRLVSLVV